MNAIELIDILLLGLLVATAFIMIRMKNLWALVMLTGIYSFLGASWMMVLDAPDVAFTEAAVGAGISTLLFLATLALTGIEKKESQRNQFLAVTVVLLTAGALIYGTLDMPHFGSADAPIHLNEGTRYVEMAHRDMHVPNVVTAVLGSYRGYDTLGETTVIFTAGMAVLLLLRRVSARSRNEK